MRVLSAANALTQRIPSDVVAGRQLAIAVADKVIARAKQDGAEQQAAKTVPEGGTATRVTDRKR
jgi:hypothetical protein